MPVLDIARTWNGELAPETERVRLELELRGDHLHLRVQAPFHGDPPPEGLPGPTEGLWEHEVVELFVAGPANVSPDASTDVYTEIELGPHGHHLVLRLAGVRNAIARALPLAFQARIEADRWIGEAAVPIQVLPPRPWRINAYAIHGRGDRRRYLAWNPVPGERPDFHQLDRFLAWPPL